MKDVLKKFASGMLEAVGMFQKWDNENAINKLSQIAKDVEDEAEKVTETDAATATETATETETATTETTTDENGDEWEITKFTKKEVEFIKKWAYLTIDAQNVVDLVEQFQTLKDGITKNETDLKDVVEKVNKIASTPIVKTATGEEIIEKSSGLGAALLPY